jgi:hypothetical protein
MVLVFVLAVVAVVVVVVVVVQCQGCYLLLTSLVESGELLERPKAKTSQ